MLRPIHVVQISFFSDPEERLPVQLLEAWPTLVDVADAVRRSGARVFVVQASSHRERVARGGVHYHFLPFGESQRAALPAPAGLGELLRGLAPDVLHVHGLGFPRDVLALAALAPGVPIILQDHADKPPRIWLRSLWRRQMSVCTGIAFCALEQARPFVRAGILGPATRLYEIPESTSRFAPGDRQEARRVTGLDGDPAVLWVGHLNANKDPLTVLQGVRAAARELPGLRLHCCFGTAPLLREVRHRIGTDPELRTRVRLLGRVPHARIEHLMRAADLFVLGSHHEGSGYSLIEALACGLPPVVTDIPSFRSITGSGAVGRLWPCGDAEALGAAIRTVAAGVGPQMREAVRARFELALSSDSLGGKLTAMYEDALGRKHGVAGWGSRSGASGVVPTS